MALADNWESFIRIHGGEPGARDMFEKAMDELLREENPDKEVHRVKAAQGDGGIDVYVDKDNGIDVYQCKFFRGSLDSHRWSNIKESFERAVKYLQTKDAKGVKMLGWYLCMPREMQKEDILKWDIFKTEKTSMCNVIKIVDGNEIIQRMQKCDYQNGTNLINKYFYVKESDIDELNVIPQCLTPIPPINQKIGLVGREKIKSDITSMLNKQGGRVLVSGLGGIGKTTIMKWVCNDIRCKGKYVAWINCGKNFKEDILILGEALGISLENPDSAYKKIISALKNRLNGFVYLFLDDLTENLSIEELSDLNSLNAHIMVTSRRTYDAFVNYRLEELEYNPAVNMFFEYYNGDIDRTYEEAVCVIVNAVNRHTLLIELLAKAAKKSGGTLEDFNKRLNENGVYDVFKRKVNTAHDGNATIEACVLRLYEFSPLSETQKHILKLFSIFSPDKEIYYKVSEWAKLDMNSMDELIELSWIDQVGSENNYKIHQIIRESIIKQMQKTEVEVRIEDYGDFFHTVINTDNYIPLDYDYVKIRDRLILATDVAEYIYGRFNVIKEKKEYSVDTGQFFMDSATLFSNIAQILYRLGYYDKALEYYLKAAEIYSTFMGKHFFRMATVYNNIGILFCHKGCYKEALSYYEQSLIINKKEYGSKDPRVATVYNNIGGAYSELDDFKEALKNYKAALDIDLVEYGANHPETATVYNNMAQAYEKLGDMDQAMKYYNDALKIRESMFGNEHIETAKVYNNYAGLLLTLGKRDKALEMYNDALNICKKILGLNHPYTATVCCNLARLFYEQCEYKTALEYSEIALPILKETLGENHLHTQVVQDNIDFMREFLETNTHE